MKTLNQIRDETEKVTKQMPGNNKWTIHQRFTELVEEVGELGNAIQTDEGFKSKKRRKSELVDSVCDVLFEIFNISAHYKVDRRKSGEFDHE